MTIWGMIEAGFLLFLIFSLLARGFFWFSVALFGHCRNRRGDLA